MFTKRTDHLRVSQEPPRTLPCTSAGSGPQSCSPRQKTAISPKTVKASHHHSVRDDDTESETTGKEHRRADPETKVRASGTGTACHGRRSYTSPHTLFAPLPSECPALCSIVTSISQLPSSRFCHKIRYWSTAGMETCLPPSEKQSSCLGGGTVLLKAHHLIPEA